MKPVIARDRIVCVVFRMYGKECAKRSARMRSRRQWFFNFHVPYDSRQRSRDCSYAQPFRTLLGFMEILPGWKMKMSAMLEEGNYNV
jgi:hypothetical protein